MWGSRNISTSRNKRFSHYPPDAQNHRSKKGIQKNIDVLNGQNYRGDKIEKLHLTNIDFWHETSNTLITTTNVSSSLRSNCNVVKGDFLSYFQTQCIGHSAYHSNFDTSCIFIADAGLSRKLVAPFATASNITKACAELLSQQ